MYIYIYKYKIIEICGKEKRKERKKKKRKEKERRKKGKVIDEITGSFILLFWVQLKRAICPHSRSFSLVFFVIESPLRSKY